MAIVFSQTAPWSDGKNPLLRNGYRTRFAQVGDRYFKISAEHLNDMWTVEEINADGTDYYRVTRDDLTYAQALQASLAGDRGAIDWGFRDLVFRLSEAREAIAKETGVLP